MDWYWWLGLLAVLVLCGFAIVKLLGGITAWGGDRMDALDNASKFSAETQAFRNARTPDDATLDGHNRIAPPTQDGAPL